MMVPVVKKEGEVQEESCFLFRVDDKKKRMPDPCGSFTLSLMVVSRLPPRPHRFRLVKRMRHSTAFQDTR